MIKAIFFDVDGTLVSFKTHKVAQSTIEALNELKKKGIKIFVASERHKVSINNLGDLQFDGYVCLNGSICFVADDVIYKHCMPKEDSQNLLHYVQKVEQYPCAFVYENELLMNFKNEVTDKIFTMLNFPEPPIADLNEHKDREVFQAIAFLNEEEEKRMLEVLPGCAATRWNPYCADIIPKGGSKWIGIKKVLEHFGIKQEETMAFGDGGNDIDMLQNAHIGIAMGNAKDDVKVHADYVTASVDEDGIMKALKHFGVL
mgnify:FL=1